ISQNPYLRMQVGVLSFWRKNSQAYAAPVGAGSPANAGKAGAIHRVACFAAVRRLDSPALVTVQSSPPTIRARTLE
ncbi:hypothetical protein, partial [Pseudomonas sp. PNPG3]|uniref:hypothetical protein n=1 Tax=Pseudomonas sp. PNPG3 TaxID=2919497 RepID=UPI001FFD76E3